MLRAYSETFTTTGADGTATASGSVGLPGVCQIFGVRIDYTDQPATVDVTLTDSGDLSGEVLAITSSATDQTYYPRVAANTGTGGNSTLTEVKPVVDTGVDVAIAQGDVDGTVRIILIVEPGF